MAYKRRNRWYRRRGGFLPGGTRGAQKSKSRSQGLSSRTSDFYARPVSRTRLALPALYRGRMRTSKAKSITRTKMQLAPLMKVRKMTSTKTRPTEDKGVRLVNIMRRRLRRPIAIRGRRNNAMEYVRTPSEGNSTSYFTRKGLRLRGMKKRVTRAAPLQVRKSDTTHSMSWVYGRQAVLSVVHNGQTELQALANLVPGSGGSAGNTFEMFMQSTKMHWLISSGSKAGVKLRIYEGCYKRDAEIAFSPITLWTNGMLDAGSTENPNDIDSKPWTSSSFNQLCHITKVTNVFLPQGRTHEHYTTYGYNKMYSKQLGNTSVDLEYRKGWTRFTIFTAYGEPVADTDADVTTASGRIVMVSTKVQRVRHASPSTYLASYSRGIPITGVTSERLLDEGSGEIETVTNL